MNTNPFLIPDRVYDFLKQIALIGLPAFSTLYFMLGTTWGLDNVTQVVGSIAAIETFLGALLGITTKAYNKSDVKYDGTIHSSIEEATGAKTYLLELNDTPEGIDNKSSIIFKVNVADN